MRDLLWLAAAGLLLWMGVSVHVLVGGFLLLCLAVVGLARAANKGPPTRER